MEHDSLVELVTTLTRQQHGLVRVDQIPADQHTRLRAMARRGRLERVAKGVYRATGAPVTWMQRLTAGVWALGPTARVSHHAAGVLFGFDRFDGEPLEFTVDRECRGRSLPAFDAKVHTTSIDSKRDRRFLAGLPVTSPARTVIDLARSGARRELVEAAIDSSIRLRLTTLDQISNRLYQDGEAPRWRTRQLDALLMTSGGHSVLERRFLQLLRRAGLPLPRPQVVHRRDGRHVARVDFLFESLDLVVEVSGGRGHSSPSERAKDARRRNDLQQMGRLVLEFTYEMVVNAGGDVISTLAEALSRRESERIRDLFAT